MFINENFFEKNWYDWTIKNWFSFVNYDEKRNLIKKKKKNSGQSSYAINNPISNFERPAVIKLFYDIIAIEICRWINPGALID